MDYSEALKYNFTCFYCRGPYSLADLSHFDPIDPEDPEFSDVAPICVYCVQQMYEAAEGIDKDE
jgi:hypothetical protein